MRTTPNGDKFDSSRSPIYRQRLILCMNKLGSLNSVAECFPKRSRLFSFEQLCQTKVQGKDKFLFSPQDCSKRSYILLP